MSALVASFEALTASQVQRTNEEATKQGYILPLLHALGWNPEDVNEVAPEERAPSGRVDYAFRIRGVSRFYLEAKPLRDELTAHPEWVNQAVSYAYNKSIPYVVLTNFKDFWVFNGDIRPQRFLTLNSSQYVDELDLLWLLSKDATQQGLLEREAEKHGALAPRVSVERRLYEDLAQWRGRLSRELHLYQPEHTLALVDETVQRLLTA